PYLAAGVVAPLGRRGAGADLDGLERLAGHAARSTERRRAPEYFTRAGERALAEGDAARAARHWMEAASILREEQADAEAFELVLRAADAALSSNANELAQQALAQLAQREVAPELAVRRALLVARLAGRVLAPEGALAALEAVGGALPEVPRPLRLEALAWHGWA